MKETLLDKYKHFLPILLVVILVSIFTLLWSVLFIIPGIIFAFKAAMVNYIVAEESDIDAMEAIKRSKAMMNGHKWEYFVFMLSFLGWILLCVVTFGIALIWVMPYTVTAQIMYYEQLKTPKKSKK